MITRRMAWLAPLLACVPFLLADSCVKQVFVTVEYQLRNCPQPGFELPQNVDFGGWTLQAGEGSPYCHGFARYVLEEKGGVGAFSEGLKAATVYARVEIDRAHMTCSLKLITDLYCASRESIEDCDPKGLYVGSHAALKPAAGDYADIVAQRLLLGQKASPVVPAHARAMLGRVEALERFCQKL